MLVGLPEVVQCDLHLVSLDKLATGWRSSVSDELVDVRLHVLERGLRPGFEVVEYGLADRVPGLTVLWIHSCQPVDILVAVLVASPVQFGRSEP